MRGTIGLNKEKLQLGTSRQPSGPSEAGIPIERAVSTRRAGKRQFMHGSIRRNQKDPKGCCTSKSWLWIWLLAAGAGAGAGAMAGVAEGRFWRLAFGV